MKMNVTPRGAWMGLAFVMLFGIWPGVAGATSTPPVVTGVSSPVVNGAYSVGAVIPITVGFSENVVVGTGTGTLSLALSDGGTAFYAVGSGTSTLVFLYTVGLDDRSTGLDYAGTSAVALNGATIEDGDGNAATLTLATPGTAGSLSATKEILINETGTGAPTAYTVAPSSGSNGTISPGVPQGVMSGSSARFTAMANSGYGVNEWLVDGSPVRTSGTTYTVEDVTGNETVEVTFARATGTAAGGKYEGVIVGGSGFAGVATMSVANNGRFSGRMIEGGVARSFAGKFGATGAATIGGTPSLTLQAGETGSGTPGSHLITGFAGDGSSFTAYHTAHAKGGVIAEAGKTVVALYPTTVGGDIPVGPGVGKLNVEKSGGAHFAGKLPDGEPFSMSAQVVGGPTGDECIFYTTLNYKHATPHGARGVLGGAITFPGKVVTGPLVWMKPVQTKGEEEAGFETGIGLTP